MLIEFSVSNFRSFRERQTLSMVAASKLRKRENVFKAAVLAEKIPDLLKVVAIYGPNASGKSNLLLALGVVGRLSIREPNSDKPLPVAPFRFDSQLVHEPSRFEYHFIADKVRYEFDLAITQDRIFEERLVAYPKGKERLLYHRWFKDGVEHFSFGDYLEGGNELHEVWRKLTGSRILFISQAVANSNDELQQLRKPLDWLRQGIALVQDGHLGRWANATQRLAIRTPGITEEITEFLRDADVPVSEIEFRDGLSVGSLSDADGEGTDREIGPGWVGLPPKKKMVLRHRTALGEAEFEFSEESNGTRNLIGFWLPWSVHVDQVGTGSGFNVLAVDEMDSSLHPEIMVSLVAKHIHAKVPSQIIFTTHDTHLMDSKLMRRDQFWVVDRDGNGATQLQSIHEFEGRESEDLEKRYYEGRYRGLPILRKV